MNTFKHSGAFGDLIYSLPLVKHLGGGDFYLHLNQIDWIGQYYYGSKPNPYHQGRMRPEDYEYMRSFMEAQEYIQKFDVMQPSTEITHNLDHFRPLFVQHPGNYVDTYSQAMKVRDPLVQKQLRTEPWLTVPTPQPIPGRPVVVNRTSRWIPPSPGAQWRRWQDQGIEQEAVFVGLAHEYEEFKRAVGWDIPHHECPTMLDLAQVIAAADMFIGNQSMALSLAIGLGVQVVCEPREDLPLERNECYFGDVERIQYFAK